MNGFASKRNAKGITMISFILVLAVVGFFASILMTMWGPYYEYRNVVSAMKSVASEPGAASKDITILQRELGRRFDVGYVDSVDPRTTTIIQDKGVRVLNIDYEVRKHYALNIDFVLTFDFSAPLNTTNTSGE